jgi:hypothetical protein
VNLQHLADVHTTRHTQRIKDDIHGRAIFQERHIFNGDYFGNHTLVPMAARHFVTSSQLAALSD